MGKLILLVLLLALYGANSLLSQFGSDVTEVPAMVNTASDATEGGNVVALVLKGASLAGISVRDDEYGDCAGNQIQLGNQELDPRVMEALPPAIQTMAEQLSGAVPVVPYLDGEGFGLCLPSLGKLATVQRPA